MTKIALLTAAALALLTVGASAQYGGPYYGKGKAPPRRRRRSLPKAEHAIRRDRPLCRSFIFLGTLR